MVNKLLKKIVQGHKKEISELLSRLNSRVKVGVSLPNFNIDRLPYNLTLGDSKVDISLNNWGSGTKNRTMILLALLRAKQVSDSYASASKITPVLIIEEPESFLHPSAQAEFGQVLQQLSNDFEVQVITTTHSPYMLNQQNPESNILLERKVSRKQLRETVVVDTSGENWMEPFGIILGISNEEFKPWRELFFSETRSLLLVEREIDKEYFELLRKEEHGNKKLNFDGDIFDYDGCSTLKNPTLLKFIRNRCKSVVITFDLDVAIDVEPTLKRNGFEKNKSYITVGIDEPGKRCIEGLLPEEIRKEVINQNADLVQQAMYGDKDEQRSAKNLLKRKYLESFKQNSVPGEEHFKEFYRLVSVINNNLRWRSNRITATKFTIQEFQKVGMTCFIAFSIEQ
jgi:predicted ATP-dependent endonuclease of OLD family